MNIRGVLFDWRGTLVHDPPHEWWVRAAFARAGRDATDREVYAVSEQLRRAAEFPEVREAEIDCDCSRELHRAYSTLFFRAAGLDDELANALYDIDLDTDSDSHRLYPDAPGVLRALHDRGIRVGVLSDIHFDLRPEFAAAGLADAIDAFVLSFEHGVQKPDPRIFAIAAQMLDVAPEATLMVGDRASHDGGAVAAGMLTLLFPPPPAELVPRGLACVLALID